MFFDKHERICEFILKPIILFVGKVCFTHVTPVIFILAFIEIFEDDNDLKLKSEC